MVKSMIVISGMIRNRKHHEEEQDGTRLNQNKYDIAQNFQYGTIPGKQRKLEPLSNTSPQNAPERSESKTLQEIEIVHCTYCWKVN